MSHLPDIFFLNGERPNKGKKVFTWLWMASVLFFLALPKLGIDCLFGQCISNQAGWVFASLLLGTGLAFIGLGVVNIFTKDELTDWGLDDAEKKGDEMILDPAALAEKLVREAPASRAKNYDHLELEAIRWLMDELEGEEFDRAMVIVCKRLAELLDTPVPDRSVMPDVAAPRPAPKPEPRDLIAHAEAIISRTFSAPYDGSEEKLDVFAKRARGSCAHLLKAGLDANTCETMIRDHVAQLRAAYESYR